MNVDRCHRAPKNNFILFIILVFILAFIYFILNMDGYHKASFYFILLCSQVKKKKFFFFLDRYHKAPKLQKGVFCLFLFCFVLKLSVRKIPKCFETSHARFHVSQTSLVLDFLYWSSLMSNLALFILMQIWSVPQK